MNLIFAIIILLVNNFMQFNCCRVKVKTVQQVLDEGGCSTAAIAGLAIQLTNTMGTPFSNITGVPGLKLGSAVQVVPFLQSSALAAIEKAIAANKGNNLTLNSALRTVPQQTLLYEWFLQGKCGIKLAASPGNSNHESGLAIDTSNYIEWREYLEAEGCEWYGDKDPVHFTCPGVANPGDSVRAFQRLWNCNHDNDKLEEDGVYNNQTRSRILISPAVGFNIVTC